MSIRHLHSLLEPASVVVIGASDHVSSVGATVWRNLRAGAFKGLIYGVNPHHDTLDGVTYRFDLTQPARYDGNGKLIRLLPG